MLTKLKNFFDINLQAEEKPNKDQIQLAAAALLIEIVYVDRKIETIEADTLLAILHQRFAIAKEKLDDLVNIAKQEVKESTSLYQFTRLINDNYGDKEKFELVQSMWEIAYADGNLDKYEEALIRKIADLIHLKHQHFIQAKHMARDQMASNKK